MALTLSFTEQNILVLLQLTKFYVSFLNFPQDHSCLVSKALSQFFELLFEKFSLSLRQIIFLAFRSQLFSLPFGLVFYETVKKAPNNKTKQTQNLSQPFVCILLCFKPYLPHCYLIKELLLSVSPPSLLASERGKIIRERMIQRRNRSWKWEVGSWLFLAC